MSTIREAMPVLTRHEGVWGGAYTTVDNDGTILDQHECRITCEFPDDQPYPYFQTNRYTWADGKVEEYQFPGAYQDKVLLFDTERIEGKAWEADDSLVILWFAYKGIPDAFVYEMIHLSKCNNHRARTWHWFKQGEIYQRTLIKEHRVQ
ncbi:DUF3598 family protein [Leptothoe kymatousa]|uniref:DUF3598 family protein n=1 Tax=Leptothoe kymatousa TAU-MAC 1615 TaxID=2364775 RepID=A0ABS5Y4R1_9CYAN|nr:DUF3598 family protein [Leptothoe kymatousa]MBT9312815.1 DUF3598 family protein [Leptothoe kymatousa TAU-MAC 1615]